jgi:hypothetical protein
VSERDATRSIGVHEAEHEEQRRKGKRDLHTKCKARILVHLIDRRVVIIAIHHPDKSKQQINRS